MHFLPSINGHLQALSCFPFILDTFSIEFEYLRNEVNFSLPVDTLTHNAQLEMINNNSVHSSLGAKATSIVYYMINGAFYK